MLKRIKIITIVLSVVLFSISLILPPFYIKSDNSSPWPAGFWCLIFGWYNLDGSGISWLANPLLILSWFYLFSKTKVALWLGLVALLFSSSFLFANEVIINEGGGMGKIERLGAGYFLWLASTVVFSIGTIAVLVLNKKQPYYNLHELEKKNSLIS